MKQFIAFIRKEFYHILRDRRTMLILIGMPIVQIILFGFAISTEVRNIQTAILAPSTPADIRLLIDRLDASEYFTVKYLVRTEAELNELFRQNKIELAVAFSEDLNRRRPGSRQIQVIADATDPNQAITCNAYLQGILSPALAELQAASPSGTALNLHTRLLYNPQMRSAYNFVPGVMGLILMLICAMMTSISIVREKETGTMEVLLAFVRHTFQSSTLFPAFHPESDDHPAPFSLRTSRPHSGQPDRPVRCFPAFHLRIPLARSADFVRNPYAGGCPADFGHAADDAYHPPFGHDFSCREHAAHPSGIFLPYPRPMVYQCSPQTDDRGCALRLRLAGNLHPFPYGNHTDRHYNPQIQEPFRIITTSLP